MKTAKKLFSLLLVAVLLMSAIPFQASATDGAQNPAPATITTRRVVFMVDGTVVKTVVLGDNKTLAKSDFPTVTVPTDKEFSGWSMTLKTGQTITGDNIARQFADTEMHEVDATTLSIGVTGSLKDKHKHTYTDTIVAPKCTEDGYTKHESTCDIDGIKCNHTYTDTPTDKLGHNFEGEWITVTPAGVGTAGLAKRKCSRCDAYETKELAAIPVPTYTITFISEESDQSFTDNWEANHLITYMPTPDPVVNKSFDGWYTAKVGGERVQVGNTWYGTNQYTTLYARFIDSTKDNVSTVSVFVRFYSEGIQQGETIFMDSFTLKDNSKLLPALQAKQAAFANKIYTIKSSNDYLWNESFYMYASGEKITDSDMRINGDTSILLKVDAKKSAKANVLLYVHNKAGEAATRLYEMNGYTAGNTVTSAAVQNFLKAQTGKTYTISGLYDQDRWEQLADGQNPTAAGGLDVPTSGTLKIHVILSNFSSSTSSKPASNPSTGDPIMATAGIMVLAAAALVSILELRKRKMI